MQQVKKIAKGVHLREQSEVVTCAIRSCPSGGSNALTLDSTAARYTRFYNRPSLPRGGCIPSLSTYGQAVHRLRHIHTPNTLQPDQNPNSNSSNSISTKQSQTSKHAAVDSALQMRYRIPHATITKAARLEALGRPYVWYSHKLYVSSHGKKVIVEYCDTLETSEATARKFIGEQVLGFDMEWKSQDATTVKENVALIQIASEERIALFHIARHTGQNPDELVAPTLKTILESKTVYKTGVAIRQADGVRLEKYLGMQPGGLIELSELHHAIVEGPHTLTRKLVSMARLTKQYLQLPLSKGSVRVSNWALRLSQAQTDYAATDAYAGLQLFHTLQHRLQSLPPPPEAEKPTAKPSVPEVPQSAMILLESLAAETERISKIAGVSTESISGGRLLRAIALPEPKTLRRLRNLAIEWNPEAHDAAHEFLRVIRENFVLRASEALYTRLLNLGINIFEETSCTGPLLSTAKTEHLLTPRIARRLSIYQPQTIEELSDVDISEVHKHALLQEIRSYQAESNTPSPILVWSRSASAEAVEDRVAAYEKNLRAFRTQLARAVSMRPDEVASLITVMDISQSQPTTVEELENIDGVQSLLEAAALRAWASHDLLELLKRLNRAQEDTTVSDNWTFLEKDPDNSCTGERVVSAKPSRESPTNAPKGKELKKPRKPAIRKASVSDDDDEFFSTMRVPHEPAKSPDSPPEQLSQGAQTNDSDDHCPSDDHKGSSGSVLAHAMLNLSSMYSYKQEGLSETKKEDLVTWSPRTPKKRG